MKFGIIHSLFTFALIIALFANTSCKKVSETNFEETIVIDFNDKLVDNTSELFEDVSYLHLNAGIDKPLGEITSLKIFDSVLVVFDESRQSLFLFDANGGFISSVNNIGRGPGEYLSISDYNIIDENLYIITNRSKIDRYSLEGDFIENVGSSQDFFDQFQMEQDEYVILSKLNEDENRILIFDKEFNLVEQKLPYKDDNVPLYNFWPELSMFKANSEVLFYLPEYYGIYSYSRQKVLPKYKYHFKGISIDLDNLSANEINSNILPVIRGINFIGDYLITQVTYENTMYQHVYSFQSKKSKLYNVFEINNDMDDLGMSWSLSCGASEKSILSAIPFEIFEGNTDSLNFLNDFVEEIDNPVIGIFSIKGF